jgi:simple sugar transport system substrate-binding protein
MEKLSDNKDYAINILLEAVMLRKLAFAMPVMVLFFTVGLLPSLAQEDEFIFGMILVGAKDDGGWSQSHYDAGRYVEEKIEGTRMIVFEKLNPADSPEVTLPDVVGNMVSQGAELIFVTSEDFKTATNDVARQYSEIIFVNVAGDNVLTGSAPTNVSNIMGQMEWTKLIAGCAAGLTTRTGKIGYLGPVINYETRRLAVSAFLGARHCYETMAHGDPSKFSFTVTWIGFWFNIPDVTLDPTQEVDKLFDSGVDVVISGIDTPEALTATQARFANGDRVWAVPYDNRSACEDEAVQDICIGVPYFNWGPSYMRAVLRAKEGMWQPSWEWLEPDWTNINNPETSIVGFQVGPALKDEDKALLDDFTDYLATYATNPFVPESIALWQGPLNWQDGTRLASEGQLVDMLDIWYTDQLLEGMIGTSQ